MAHALSCSNLSLVSARRERCCRRCFKVSKCCALRNFSRNAPHTRSLRTRTLHVTTLRNVMPTSIVYPIAVRCVLELDRVELSRVPARGTPLALAMRLHVASGGLPHLSRGTVSFTTFTNSSKLRFAEFAHTWETRKLGFPEKCLRNPNSRPNLFKISGPHF